MSSTETLVCAALALAVLYALAWTAASGPLKLSSSTSLRFSLGNLLLGAALVTPLVHSAPVYFTGLFIPHLVALVGLIGVRVGIQQFLRLEANGWEYVGLLLLVAAADAYSVLENESTVLAAIALALALAWLTLRLAWEAVAPLRLDFSLQATLTMVGPFAFLGAVALIYAGCVASDPGFDGWTDSPTEGGAHIVALGCTFVALMVMNLSCLGLVLARLVSHIRELTLRDGLTGILNRRAVEMSLTGEYEKLRRHGQIFCVASLDLDRFKKVNDEFGHAAGDAALFHAVQIAKGQLRNCDVIGRVGDEEFLVIFPMTRAHGGREAAERIRAALDLTPFAWDNRSIAVTTSVGVAECFNPEEPPHALLRRADDALYRAKNAGRNRVEVAPN